MGVPAFYRWLSEKYPKIVDDVLEERIHLVHESGSTRAPFDITKRNPSKIECDNFYIDMNGIIHPCSHPENGPQPKTEEEMYENVCHYVDRLFRATRPRKLLYLAIDGVAPRAKMNQQRARRFRSAQEAKENAETERHVKQHLIKCGHKFDEPEDSSAWDSNVITPGTTFMLNLSEFIRFYIRKRISTDKAWKSICVIFSDASIPGEGEHKIMSHIRLQRSQSNYNPNLVHVLHGLDADLIMLALATHEPNFYILREEVVFGYKNAQTAEQRKIESGHEDAQRQLNEAAGAVAMELPENKSKPLQRVSIPILREYLANEFKQCQNVPFRNVSFERLIDDIVFLCFFVGNDFIPHLPSMDIRDGALDFLFNVYRRILPSLGDYITSHSGEVNLRHVDVILAEVGSMEDYIFHMKYENEQNENKRKLEFAEKKKLLTKDGKGPKAGAPMVKTTKEVPRGRAAKLLESIKNNNSLMSLGRKATPELKLSGARSKTLQENTIVAKRLKAELWGAKEIQSSNNEGDDSSKNEKIEVGKNDTTFKYEKERNTLGKRKADSATCIITEQNGINNRKINNREERQNSTNEDPKVKLVLPDISENLLKTKIRETKQKKLDMHAANVKDKVRLHEKGWKDRYYTDKCKADDVAENGGREHLYRSYVMGLCWVMKYYYDGCPSWKWYYPFHYAPFASDLRNIDRFSKDYKKIKLDAPFKPVEQLMAVLPEDSSHAVPQLLRWFMSDPESPILDFYPKDILCDPNGKAMPWLWVVLLPFIDEGRLLSAIAPSVSKWKEHELLCNARGIDDGYIYCHVTHPFASAITAALDSKECKRKQRIEKVADFEQHFISGFIRKPPSNEVYSLDDISTINPPKDGGSDESWDNLFTTTIDTNAALCAAFTEPEKSTHYSVFLRGTQPLDCVLNGDDYRIRRPRLNRGGNTIANLGGAAVHQRQSYQTGYGSMNISSCERNLAERTGRGHQINQTGTRLWGAIEPIPKRSRIKNCGETRQNQHYPTLFQQPICNKSSSARASNDGNARQSHPRDYGNYQRQRWQPPPQPLPHQYPVKHDYFKRRPPSQRQSHTFRGTQQNYCEIPVSRQEIPSVRHATLPQKSGVNPSLMKSLRSQLSSTLKKKNHQGGERGSHK